MSAPARSEGHCGVCGEPLGADHTACAAARLDPDRFCRTCGRRLDVQVYPDRVEARCRRCAPASAGRVSDAPAAP